MAVIKVKPTSPGRRAVVKVVHKHLHKGAPEASLLEPQKQKAGRNNNGHITMRHKGGGHKHHYRVVDFKRSKDGIAAKVERIEYDPNRSAHIARGDDVAAHCCRAPRRRSRLATRCRSATSRSARPSIVSRCCRARERRSRARPGPR